MWREGEGWYTLRINCCETHVKSNNDFKMTFARQFSVRLSAAAAKAEPATAAAVEMAVSMTGYQPLPTGYLCEYEMMLRTMAAHARHNSQIK